MCQVVITAMSLIYSLSHLLYFMKSYFFYSGFHIGIGNPAFYWCSSWVENCVLGTFCYVVLPNFIKYLKIKYVDTANGNNCFNILVEKHFSLEWSSWLCRKHFLPSCGVSVFCCHAAGNLCSCLFACPSSLSLYWGWKQNFTSNYVVALWLV